MDWSLAHSLLFGVISGFAEFLPVSAEAHQILFGVFTGAGSEIAGFRLACRVGVLLALLLSCRPQLQRIRRERRLASVPPKRRKRQPDQQTMRDVRVLKTACVPALLSLAAYPWLMGQVSRLWLLAILLAVNGLILYIPRMRRVGNKDSRHMSVLDAVFQGLGGAVGTVPGLSRLGCTTGAAQLIGADPQAGLELVLVMFVPILTALTGIDAYLAIVGSALTVGYLLLYVVAAAAAAISAYFGIVLVRFLAVHEGFSVFSYYCWGAAMLIFILYLMI